MRIGNTLKKIRKSQGYSAKEFSHKIGIPHTTYSNYENDNREPNLDILNKIAKGLNVKIDDIVNATENNTSLIIQPHERKKQILFNHFEDLNEPGKDKAIESVELLTKVPDYKKQNSES